MTGGAKVVLVAFAAGALGVIVLAVGVRIQAIQVEEPHLRHLHGHAYEVWVRRTGRFLPPMT